MTAPTINSSGNLQADRRFDMAMQFFRRGDHEAARDLFMQARELTPSWPPPSFHLGEALAALGRDEAAAAAFQDYLALDPADVLGAAIKLALLGAIPVPETLPSDYVETLFDDYAPRFDNALVEKLGYCGPQLLADAVARAGTACGGGATILDLGCGTGLVGAAFRAQAAWLEGIDLSAMMIAEAETKGIYDRLHHGDILAPFPVESRLYDIVLAADVLIYIGALEGLFQAVRQILKPGGLFAFSTQRAPGDETGQADDFILGADHRYAHSTAYIENCAVQAGLKRISLAYAVVRRDAGTDITGHVAVYSA